MFPWRENGHLLDYVEKNPGSNKNYLVGSVENHEEPVFHRYGLVSWFRSWVKLPPPEEIRAWEWYVQSNLDDQARSDTPYSQMREF